jgi:hypothetical protein
MYTAYIWNPKASNLCPVSASACFLGKGRKSNIEIMNAIKPLAPLCPAGAYPLLFFSLPSPATRHETKAKEKAERPPPVRR